MPQEQFIIFLCQPGHIIKKISVSKKATVSQLATIFPNSCFIFNGMTLQPCMKLETYGIRDMDHLVALPEDENSKHTISNEKATWMIATRDQKDFNNKMLISTNNSTRIEAERLKDLKITKIELKRKTFNKMISKITKEAESIYPKKVIPTNLNYSQKISTGPLPVFWSSPKRETFKILRRASEPDMNLDQPINA